MKEIKIEKIRTLWPWFLGIIILILLVLFIGINGQKEKSQVTQEPIDLISVKENNLSVAAFVRFMEEDTLKMELDHTFTKEAFLKINRCN